MLHHGTHCSDGQRLLLCQKAANAEGRKQPENRSRVLWHRALNSVRRNHFGLGADLALPLPRNCMQRWTSNTADLPCQAYLASMMACTVACSWGDRCPLCTSTLRVTCSQGSLGNSLLAGT